MSKIVNGVIVRNTPIVKIAIAGLDAQNVQDPFVLVDTGFTGDLKVCIETAQNLRLIPSGVENVKVGHGKIVPMTTSLAFVVLGGMVKLVNVLIADGTEAIGIGLLKKIRFKLNVDTPLDVFSIYL